MWWKTERVRNNRVDLSALEIRNLASDFAIPVNYKNEIGRA
jgi:hypothetical protein